MSQHTKNFVATQLVISGASEFCRDIDFFVTTKLLIFQRSSMLQHKFEMLQHKINYCNNLLFSPLHLFVTMKFSFVVTKIFTSSSSSCCNILFLCCDKVSQHCMGLLL